MGKTQTFLCRKENWIKWCSKRENILILLLPRDTGWNSTLSAESPGTSSAAVLGPAPGLTCLPHFSMCNLILLFSMRKPSAFSFPVFCNRLRVEACHWFPHYTCPHQHGGSFTCLNGARPGARGVQLPKRRG